MQSELATMPETVKKKGPMKMKDLRIRKLDDNSFLVDCSYEGGGRYESKQSSYQTVEEVAGAVKRFLKVSNLAER